MAFIRSVEYLIFATFVTVQIITNQDFKIFKYKGGKAMKKVFEDYFSEIQADMVAICL